MGIFDEANRKYDLRKEKEKIERNNELQRIISLEKAERSLIQEFNGYLPKMSSELNKKGFQITISQTDINPWLKATDINTRLWASIVYKRSDAKENKGTVYVELNSSNSNAAYSDEYYIDENCNVKTKDQREFNLEDEVVRHYEELLNQL
ncbi:hypothetical protein [Macrococcus capreoli]|uniref:hypothetical protein n=1 Tax=Macrococcus capreoli TaxID=2982690 RepID=UPI003EE5D3E9